LAVAISGFLENPARRRDFGDNARRRVGSEFSREVMARRMQNLYASLLGV
jgi:glycosyltransferase involved in cell wall biosynthesis